MIAPDDRIQLAAPGQLSQVTPVLLQGLIGCLRVLAGDPLAATNLGESLQNGRLVQTIAVQRLPGKALRPRQRQQQVLRADVFIVHLTGQLLGVGCHVGQGARQTHLGCCAVRLGPPVELRFQVTNQQTGAGAHPLGDLRRDPVRLAQQGQ